MRLKSCLVLLVAVLVTVDARAFRNGKNKGGGGNNGANPGGGSSNPKPPLTGSITDFRKFCTRLTTGEIVNDDVSLNGAFTAMNSQCVQALDLFNDQDDSSSNDEFDSRDNSRRSRSSSDFSYHSRSDSNNGGPGVSLDHGLFINFILCLCSCFVALFLEVMCSKLVTFLSKVYSLLQKIYFI
mgnify:FL=1